MAGAAKPLALVIGVGPGTGAAIARRFSEGGYRVAMLARDADRLSKLEAEIPDAIAMPSILPWVWGWKGAPRAWLMPCAPIYSACLPAIWLGPLSDSRRGLCRTWGLVAA
jgi:hypothetical protein